VLGVVAIAASAAGHFHERISRRELDLLARAPARHTAVLGLMVAFGALLLRLNALPSANQR